MLIGQGIFALAALILWVYCVFDVIRTPEGTTQNLPKMIWLLVVIFVPPIGPIAWLLLGRPANAGFQLSGPTRYRAEPEPPPTLGLPAAPPVSPDEHQRRRDEAIRRYNEEREQELKRREEELLAREEELRKREEDLGGGSSA
jgi:hypothetical protein